MGAVHRDDEHAIVPRLIAVVDKRALQEHAVLDADGVQLAWPHGQGGEVARAPQRRGDANPPISVMICMPKTLQRRMQEALPRMRPDRIAEERRVIGAFSLSR